MQLFQNDLAKSGGDFSSLPNALLGSSHSVPADLEGVRVMVIEDEAVVSMMIEQMLEDFGCVVVDLASRLRVAVAAAECTQAQVAVLDMNLAGDPIDAVVEVLERRGIPFVFATGYGRHDLRACWACRPVLAKPFREEQLRRALIEALG